MKRLDPWLDINPNKNVPWVKFPNFVIPLLRWVDINDSELYVLLFLFSCVRASYTEVYAMTCIGVKQIRINHRTYYKAIDKFKNMGLVKKGNGVYDLSGLISFLGQQLKTIDKIPLEEEEND